GVVVWGVNHAYRNTCRRPIPLRLDDGNSSFAAIHRRGVGVWVVDMCSCMRGCADPLDRPALTIGKHFGGCSGEKSNHVLGRLLMINRGELWPMAGRV